MSHMTFCETAVQPGDENPTILSGLQYAEQEVARLCELLGVPKQEIPWADTPYQSSLLGLAMNETFNRIHLLALTLSQITQAVVTLSAVIGQTQCNRIR